MSETVHRSVLLAETIELLQPKPGGHYIDATLGLGGHAEAILKRAADVTVLGIDRDPEAIRAATGRLKEFGQRFKAVHANFSEVHDAAAANQLDSVDGIIADLGVSSMQFDSETRGFSFRFDAPLDMRMDPTSEEETAAELLARLSEEEIANVIYLYGEERASRRIARRIVEKREKGEPISTTKQLADLVEAAIGRKPGTKIHPATRTFQALRIAVNDELDVIEGFLNDAFQLLTDNGRLAIITFHSLEDRIVKQVFQRLAGKCICPPRIPKCICGAEKKAEVLTKRPIAAAPGEIDENPRSRSAKLRAIRKI
jgi:16S rRNA (cytosine1402-N4)-methyltransferase